MAARISSTEEELATTVARGRTTEAELTSISTTARVSSKSPLTSDTSTLVRVVRPTTTSSSIIEIEEETTPLPTTTRSTSSLVPIPSETPIVAAITTIPSTPSNAQGVASATSTAFQDVVTNPEKPSIIGPVIGAVGGVVVLLLLAWLGRLCYKRKHSKKDLARLDKMYKGEDKFEGGIYEDKSEKPPQQYSYSGLGSPNPVTDLTPPAPAFGAPYIQNSGSTTSLSRPSSIRSFDSSAPFFPSSDTPFQAQLPNTKAHTTQSRPASPTLPSEHFISPTSPLSNPFTTPTLSQDGFRSSTPPPGSPVPLLDSNPPTIQVDDHTASYVIMDDSKHEQKESVDDFGFMGALMGSEEKK